MKEIQTFTARKSTAVVLLGNKSDSLNKSVSEQEANEIVAEFDLRFFETSALNDFNVKESFEFLSCQIIK